MIIKNIKAIEVLDSRGTPTVSTKLTLNSGVTAYGFVPSGSSTGTHEALELRDNETRVFGKGVLNAVNNVNEIIAPALIGHDINNFFELDKKLLDLDGTKNKSKLGANAILSVSICLVKAGAMHKNKEVYEYIHNDLLGKKSRYSIPTPMINVINGGSHASGASDFQEYMLLPNQSKSFKDKIFQSAEIFNQLKKWLLANGHRSLVGDEGGYSPILSSNEKPLQLLTDIIEDSGYTVGNDFSIAIDVAANELYNKNSDNYKLSADNKTLSAEDLKNYYLNLINKYPLTSIEDPFYEDSYDDFAKLTKESKIMIVGDDLFVTNPSRFKNGIDMKAGNSILVKMNQIGSISETIETVKIAKENDFNVIISHRSGDTEDHFIADLAVGLSSEYIKTGSLTRSERVSKYNRLLWIEQDIIGVQ